MAKAAGPSTHGKCEAPGWTTTVASLKTGAAARTTAGVTIGSSRVQSRQESAGRVREQVHPVQAQMDTERLDIADEPVDAERRGICRVGGDPHAAGVQQHQLP